MSKHGHVKTRSSRDLFNRYSIKAFNAITKAKITDEPKDIKKCKSSLKYTKHLTSALETIGNELYNAQRQEAIQTRLLCDKFSNVPMDHKENKFAIFVNNMGRVWSNFEEIHQIYLINMKSLLLDPLHEFNTNEIPKCQAMKVRLKTAKGKYDLKHTKSNEMKISSHTKPSKRMRRAQSVTAIKFDELEIMRSAFIATIDNMEDSKLRLLTSIKQYMKCYRAFAEINYKNVHIQHINNRMLAQNDWGKRCVLIKDGYIRFKSKSITFKRRWFTLFANKKLLIFTQSGANGIMEGHIDLSQIKNINMPNKGSNMHIHTEESMYTFQFESKIDRESWYTVIKQTCVEGKIVSITDIANNFEDIAFTEQTIRGSIYSDEERLGLEFMSIKLTFKVIVDDVEMFADNALKKRIYSVHLKKDQIVNGQFIGSKVILLDKLQFYASSSCFEEIHLEQKEANEWYTSTKQIDIDPVDPTDFFGVGLRFRILNKDIDVYTDKNLKEEAKNIELKRNEIVNGCFRGTKIIFLHTFQCYVSDEYIKELSTTELRIEYMSLDFYFEGD